MASHRILWLTEHYPPGLGGMAVSCDRIVHNVRKRGHTVDIVHFVPSASDDSAPPLTWRPQESGRDLRAPLVSDRPHSLNLLTDHLLATAPAGGWTHTLAFGGNLPLLAGPVLAPWTGSKLVTMLRGNDFDTAVFSSRKRTQLLAAVDASTGVGTVSTAAIKKLLALCPAAQTVFTPNSIDTTLWRSTPSFTAAATAWRENHNPGDKRLVVGLFGTLKAKKGATFLLRRTLEAGLADRFLFRIVGSPDAELRSLLTTAGEQIHYRLEPPAAHALLPAKYLSCDLVALPSFYDGMPNVLLEAGALGVPVIASLAGGIADVIGGGDFGFTFPAGDHEACTIALQQAAGSSPDQRSNQGGELAAHIASGFTPGAEADAVLQILTK